MPDLIGGATAADDAAGDPDLVTLLGESQYELRIHAMTGSAYHRRRERFFDTWYRCEKATTLLTASAAFVALVPDNLPGALVWLGRIAAILLALLVIVTIVFNFSGRTHLHSLLAENWDLIAARLARPLSQEDLYRADADIETLRSREPPSSRLLLAICQVEIEQALGQTPSMELKWFHYICQHWIDLPLPPQLPDKG